MVNDSAINYQNTILDNLDKRAALDHLKHQIFTEAIQEIKKCSISKCNTSSTPNVICSLKSQIETLESEVNFLRSELHRKMFC